MKILKKGTKKFKELYRIEIHRCVCHVCGAEFEAQSGEIGNPECGGYYTMVCPYCHKLHSNFGIGAMREEWVPWSQVVHYDCLKNDKKIIEED